MSRHRIGGRSNWRDRPAARHGAQPHVPGVPDDQPGMFPDLGEPVHAAPPPPPPPPPAPPAPPTQPAPSSGHGGGPWPWGINPRFGAFTRCVIGGCVLALVFGELCDQVGWSNFFVQRRILGHAPGYPTLGNAVRLVCVFGGVGVGLTLLLYDSKFWKTLFEVSIALMTILIAAFVIAAPRGSPRNATPTTGRVGVDSFASSPGPSAEDHLPEGDARATVPMPDGSDVRHATTRRNVAVGRPGQRIKHPIVLLNRGKAWWRDRYLCRERGVRDSRAVQSVTECLLIPEVPPGESVELTLEFTAPPVPDLYEARWKQATRTSGFVYPDADPVILHVRVDERL